MKKLLILSCALLFSGPAGADLATFAGGCFWCMEKPFDDLPGVLKTTSGYTGGHLNNPTYEQVSSGTTGHREAMQVEFDSAKVSYQELLNVFWRNHDPYDTRGQFCDKGEQYTAAIFYHDEKQKKSAEESRDKLLKSGSLKGVLATAILPAAKFYPAEEYHQDYYKKNPIRYKFYRLNCGRDKRLKEVWGEAHH